MTCRSSESVMLVAPDLLPSIWPLVHFEQKYRVEEKMGEGKFGSVYRVVRVDSKEEKECFAAKFMKCSRASEKLRVREEIDILLQLDHVNIIRLVAAFEDSDNFVQVVEYLAGGQLFERIVERDCDLLETEVRHVVRQVCEACKYLAAKNIVHLDIKPENVVCKSPYTLDVKLVDFGFARQLEMASALVVSQGTPEFVSPEVVLASPVSTASDMWAVGVLTYVLLSGLSPFLGDTHEETLDNIAHCLYTMDETEFDNTSVLARDFVVQLLLLQPEQRVSAAQALLHPWLSHTAKNIDESSKLTWDRSKLRRFMARGQWNKCANFIKAYRSLQRT